jgi:hypothetical protein
MNNSDNLRNQIYNNMQLKTTEELMSILEQDDHEEWTDTAFEVVKKILIQRTGRLPDLPATIMYSFEKPTDWETVNWQAISDKCDQMLRGTGLLTRILVFVFLLLPLGLIIFFSPESGANKLVTFSIAFLLWAVLFGVNVWLYLRTQDAKRIVAKARVYLKDTRGRNRGTVYDVGFAIKSAFTLRKDGELVTDNNWNGHHTFSVPVQIYNRLEEQEIVNLIFLSNNRFLGLLEDFEEK